MNIYFIESAGKKVKGVMCLFWQQACNTIAFDKCRFVIMSHVKKLPNVCVLVHKHLTQHVCFALVPLPNEPAYDWFWHSSRLLMMTTDWSQAYSAFNFPPGEINKKAMRIINHQRQLSLFPSLFCFSLCLPPELPLHTHLVYLFLFVSP